MKINFKTTPAEFKTINRIVKRAMNLKIKGYSAMTCDMDITACHCNGNPLDLSRLLEADDFNFAHDILGIRAHINRDTGALENCFSPRFSAREALPVS